MNRPTEANQSPEEIERLLRSIPASQPAAPGPGCPSPADWANVAAGLTPCEEAEASARHAAACDHCGPLLRQAVSDFSDDLTPEEEATLASLAAGRAEWQQSLAARMASPSVRPEPQPGWMERLFGGWPKWAYAAAATAALAVVSVGGYRALIPQVPTALLAQAYTEQRTLELRIPGASHAPLRVTRGANDRSRLDRPAALLEAEARIARRLQSHPDDPAWLQAKGRADLLDWNYDSAIRAFKRALELQPDSPALMADLASAYFERAETSADRAIDYASVIELLAKALKAAPDDPVAIFNHAIALERMFLVTQAIEEWRHFLRVDPSSGWAEEARKRLADLEQKQKNMKQ